MAVTDHDTVGAIRGRARGRRRRPASRWCPASKSRPSTPAATCTSSGYFIDEHDRRPRRISCRRSAATAAAASIEIVDRLATLGMPVTLDLPATASADAQVPSGGPCRDDRAVGRPLVAAALVDAGHARDIADAFDRFLSPGRPAFVARRGAPPADVIARIVAAGGLASLAHPGKIGFDDAIPAWVAAGLAGDRGVSSRPR